MEEPQRPFEVLTGHSGAMEVVDANRVSRRFLAKQKMQETWAIRRSSLDTKKSKGKLKISIFVPNLCMMFREAWIQTARNFQRTENSLRLVLADTKKSPTSWYSSAPKKSEIVPKKKKKKKNGTKKTHFPSVYSMLHKSALSKQMEAFDEEMVSVLPARYDWKQAIQRLSEGRHRAFVLLDLAAMIQAHFDLNKSLPKVKWQFRVDHNRDAKVLELWTRLGVGLRCNSKYDLLQIQPSQTENLVDDPGRTRKPDGYLQRMYQKGVRTFVVDSPDEAKRVHAALLRRNKCATGTVLNYVLQLRGNYSDWQALVNETRAAAKELGHDVVGLSISLPTKEDEMKSVKHALANILAGFKKRKVQLDLTDLPATNLDDAQKKFVKDLCARPNIEVTADASDCLIVGAGALCTRINGVKKNHENNTTNYYIDDGCYGSLCQKNYSPLPLHPSEGAPGVCTVWGPTCDGLDKVCETSLPVLKQGDWLVFPQMGSVGGLGTSFNGFEPPDTVYCVLGYFRKQHQ